MRAISPRLVLKGWQQREIIMIGMRFWHFDETAAAMLMLMLGSHKHLSDHFQYTVLVLLIVIM